MTRPEAVALALYELGGEKELCDTEDVAVRVEIIAPGMFAWQRYPERIDKELVRVALSDARLKAGLVIGSHSKGWMLTGKGLEFARKSTKSVSGEPVSQRRSRDDKQWDRERSRLLVSDVFVRHQADGLGEVSLDEADAFFRLNVYVRGEARDRKIARIENQFGDDPDLGPLVNFLAARARERK